MPDERDDEIVQLLVDAGTGRTTALRQLARTRDKDKLRRRLKEDRRLRNHRHELDERRKRDDRNAETGRDNLREARTLHRLAPEGTPFQRLQTAVARMRMVETGPTSAQAHSHTKGRGGDDPTDGMRQAPPGSFQGFKLVADEWTAMVERMANLAEHDLDLLRGGAYVYGGKTSQERDWRILSHVGREVAWIAYVEQVDVRQIQRLCRAARDRGDNYRVKGGRLVREEAEMPEAA